MPKYQAITKNDFTALRWKRFENYQFAALDAVVPLVLHEMSKACMTLPIAFIQQKEAFVPVAVQGLQQGENLFVATDGRWIGQYIPAAYRGYPFALANADEGQAVLCVDIDSGLVGDDYSEIFFDEQGEASQAVKDALSFLHQIHTSREATIRICGALQAEGLIQPWPILLKSEQGDKTMQGLYRIDEVLLNSLSAEGLQRLQQAGALSLAYCQTLSMQHLAALTKLAEARTSAKVLVTASSGGELDLEFMNNNGTISFDNL